MYQEKKWMPLISVIMPTYNQGSYIKGSIQSVLDQTYSNFELIVVDNFSTDDTESVVCSFSDDRIRYLKFNNKGVIASGRNYAVQHAKGEVLAFIDSDDIWFPDKIGIQLPHLCEKDVVAVATSFEPIGNVKACYHHLKHIPEDGMKDYSYIDLVYSNPIMTSSLIMNKKCFDLLNGFDESQKFRFIEDWELWLRVALGGTIRVLGSLLLQYRISGKIDRDLREVSSNTLNIIDRQIEFGQLTEQMIKHAKGNCFINMGKAHLVKRDYSGVKFYLKGLRYSSGSVNFIRAMIGLFLYLLPQFLSVKVDEWLHSLVSIK